MESNEMAESRYRSRRPPTTSQEALSRAQTGAQMPSPEHFIHPFAEVALSNITREYPYAAHHVVASLADIVPAVEKNPAFANSYDWHSSVHMHCLLASLLGTELGRTASWRD